MKKKSKSDEDKPVVVPTEPQSTSPSTIETGRYAYDGLDRTIHEKARLGILTSLAVNPGGLLFGDLKELCSLTDGNLSRHLQTLQDAGLVEVWKRFQFKRPQTLLRLTDLGHQRLLSYLTELERVVADAASARQEAQVENSSGSSRLLSGWTPG